MSYRSCEPDDVSTSPPTERLTDGKLFSDRLYVL